MSLCFGKKKSPEESYKLWEENIKKQKNLMICIYENPLYFAIASSFSLDGKKIKILKLKKSILRYKEIKRKIKEECPICLCDLQTKFSKKYIIIECGHKFHANCFHTHVKTQHDKRLIATCPMCRHGVSPDEEKIRELRKKYANYN